MLQYGTLMHYLFEKIFRQPAEVRARWTEEELLGQVRGLVKAYAQENLGGLELLSGREKYRLGRLAQSACKLILHVEEELAQSRFSPEHLEWGLGAGRDQPPPAHRDRPGGGHRGGHRGPDRRVPGGGWPRYVRVIDFKTGRKDFRLADVLRGLNMQMLVYLAALVGKRPGVPRRGSSTCPRRSPPSLWSGGPGRKRSRLRRTGSCA